MPTTSNQGMALPFEVMWGQKLYLSNLVVFNCKAQVYIPDGICDKLDVKTRDCTFLGYEERVMAGASNMLHQVNDLF